MTKQTAGQASEVVAALEAGWRAIQAQHAEVPDAVIILASGEGKAGKLEKWGHFYARSWKRNNADAHEVLIAGEGLARPAADVMETLIHEAAHAANDACGVQDCSRQGRYHNKRFAARAEAFGLTAEPMGAFGLAKTAMAEGTAERYMEPIATIAAAQVIYRKTRADIAASAGDQDDADGDSDGKATRRSNKAECGCGRAIRVARDVLEGAPIICGACGSGFSFEDAEEGA